MGEQVTVWYDKEGDCLEILFARRKGYIRETANDAVMEKVDEEGNSIGFSILKVSGLRDHPPLSPSSSTQFNAGLVGVLRFGHGQE